MPHPHLTGLDLPRDLAVVWTMLFHTLSAHPVFEDQPVWIQA